MDSPNEILAEYFDLDTKYDIPKKDENFVGALKIDGQGIRQLRLDPVETLFSFICSSNNNISRISQMVEFLASKVSL